MFLYNITLQRATGITHAIHGNFSGEAAHLQPDSPGTGAQSVPGCPRLGHEPGPCLHRNQDAGDRCIQGEDLGITAPRC